jgi:hypothetical protein
MYKVYHFNMDKYIHFFGKWSENVYDKSGNIVDRLPCDRPDFDEYVKVADVDTDDINNVFELTNHITHNWKENEEVTAHLDLVRSTSVGDIVIDPEGKKYICVDFGWDEL